MNGTECWFDEFSHGTRNEINRSEFLFIRSVAAVIEADSYRVGNVCRKQKASKVCERVFHQF